MVKFCYLLAPVIILTACATDPSLLRAASDSEVCMYSSGKKNDWAKEASVRKLDCNAVLAKDQADRIAAFNRALDNACQHAKSDPVAFGECRRQTYQFWYQQLQQAQAEQQQRAMQESAIYMQMLQGAQQMTQRPYIAPVPQYQPRPSYQTNCFTNGPYTDCTTK